ncbi:MAG: hypothetical protein ACTSXA_11865 [Candidatus Heimdallarchaeota archaeon]
MKSAEIMLHISEPSFRSIVNVHERRIAIYDRGGELGNSAYLFREFQKIEKQIKKLIENRAKTLQTSKFILPFLSQVSKDVVKICQLLFSQDLEEGS